MISRGSIHEKFTGSAYTVHTSFKGIFWKHIIFQFIVNIFRTIIMYGRK